jgi:hypothetical protein
VGEGEGVDVARRQKKQRSERYEYDIALSFAGEDRGYVEEVAGELKARGINVFYDEYEDEKLWGEDLYEHLDKVYRIAARYCVLFISKHYAKKMWTRHERKSAQARAFAENRGYILPVRFDNTELPGILPTVGYLDARKITPLHLATKAFRKVAPFKYLEFHSRTEFMPLEPDVLYKVYSANTRRDRDIISRVTGQIFYCLRLMSEVERRVVFSIFLHGCAHDSPENYHIDKDLLMRVTGIPMREILKALRSIEFLGFHVAMPKRGRGLEDRLVWVEWHHWARHLDEAGISTSNFTGLFEAVVKQVGVHYCDEHALQMLMRLNFSALSKKTSVDDIHGIFAKGG